MDAVLAVSALAIASAVAWADWVISCCGIGSEAMSQVYYLIMVKLENLRRGVVQKCQYLRNRRSN